MSSHHEEPGKEGGSDFIRDIVREDLRSGKHDAIVTLNRQWFRRRIAQLRDGGEGGAGSVRADHLILMGIFVASLLNSVTTEGLGAGVNVAAIWLFLCVAWLTILGRKPASVGDSGLEVVARPQ